MLELSDRKLEISMRSHVVFLHTHTHMHTPIKQRETDHWICLSADSVSDTKGR